MCEQLLILNTSKHAMRSIRVRQNGVGFVELCIHLPTQQPANKSLIKKTHQEETVTRLSRTPRFIPQILRNTLN